jgi:hypothetical protein
MGGRALQVALGDTGIQFALPAVQCTLTSIIRLGSSDLLGLLKGSFKQAVSDQAGLVVLVNPIKDTTLDKQFKRVADQTFGVHSVCVTNENLTRFMAKPKPYFANIAMKVNIKLGNTNHTVKLKDDNGRPLIPEMYDSRGEIDTIILGADVTHAQKDSKETARSLAALVGSVDGTFGQFGGSVRFQTQNQEVRHLFAPQCNILTCLSDHRRDQHYGKATLRALLGQE